MKRKWVRRRLNLGTRKYYIYKINLNDESSKRNFVKVNGTSSLNLYIYIQSSFEFACLEIRMVKTMLILLSKIKSLLWILKDEEDLLRTEKGTNWRNS